MCNCNNAMTLIDASYFSNIPHLGDIALNLNEIIEINIYLIFRLQ